jgi:hypothetical protein
MSERAVEVQGVLKTGSNKVRDEEGNEYMRPRSKLEERPGIQFKLKKPEDENELAVLLRKAHEQRYGALDDEEN